MNLEIFEKSRELGELLVASDEYRKVQEAETAAKTEREQHNNLCANLLAEGQEFAGEWTRNDRFGELTLVINQSKLVTDEAIQFMGAIYDTKLPEACLDIEGRCELAPTEQGSAVKVVIYDGQYDPDQPTAEVYDAKDGQLLLFLSTDGKLTGTMGCAAWGTDSDKTFRINLAPKAKK